MLDNMESNNSTVSSKELRTRGAELVERAARGERIVVTRYGSPRAVLGPIDAGVPARTATSRSQFDREQRAFDRMLEEGKLDQHRGRYVAIHRGRVIDVDVDASELVRRVGVRLGRRVFFVGFVGADEPFVDLPGQEHH